MKRLLLFLLMLSCFAPSVFAMKSAFKFETSDVRLERKDRDSICCYIKLNVIDDAVASRSAVVLQPYVLAGDVKFFIQPAAFYRLDKRGQRTQVRSNGGSASGSLEEVEKVCGLSRGPLELSGTFACDFRMDSIEVFVDVIEIRASDKMSVDESRRLALFTLTPMPVFVPEFYLSYVTDKNRYRFDRHLVVPLKVDFEEGKNVFKAEFGMNEGYVYDFEKSVSPVIASPNTKVLEVTMTAYSGIEGSVSSNQLRMQQRLNSVHAYLKKRGVFGKKPVKLVVEGEDWSMLQTWFQSTSWHYDRSLSDVIMGPASKDSKERNLRDCVTFWKYMEENLFPDMERFECLVRFSMIDYADNDERWKAYNSDKRLLSQYDYSCLMLWNTEWSQTWCDLAMDFAEVYPMCREALVDALAVVLASGRLNLATEYMKYLSGQEAVFYRATWLMMQGRYEEAYEVVLALDTKDNEVFGRLYDKITSVYRWSVSPTPWTGEVF